MNEKPQNWQCAKSVLPNVGKICDILANVLKVAINGRKVLESLNAKQILSRWQQKYEPFQTFAVKESVNELLALLNVDENESSESQLVSTYGIDSLKTISSVNINDQSQDPFEFINQRNLSLPPRLLAGSKGQLISECPFVVSNFPKKQRKNLMSFCPRI